MGGLYTIIFCAQPAGMGSDRRALWLCLALLSGILVVWNLLDSVCDSFDRANSS